VPNRPVRFFADPSRVLGVGSCRGTRGSPGGRGRCSRPSEDSSHISDAVSVSVSSSAAVTESGGSMWVPSAAGPAFPAAVTAPAISAALDDSDARSTASCRPACAAGESAGVGVQSAESPASDGTTTGAGFRSAWTVDGGGSTATVLSLGGRTADRCRTRASGSATVDGAPTLSRLRSARRNATAPSSSPAARHTRPTPARPRRPRPGPGRRIPSARATR
jgi:hypothetical protein